MALEINGNNLEILILYGINIYDFSLIFVWKKIIENSGDTWCHQQNFRIRS